MADNYSNLANRHSIYIEKLATHLLNEISYPELSRSYRAARRIVLDAEAITSKSQINALTKLILSEITDSQSKAWEKLTGELEDTAIYETNFYAKMFGAVNAIELIIPSDEKVLAAINAQTMRLTSGKNVSTAKWGKRTNDYTKYVADVYKAQMVAGLGDGDSTAQIVRRLGRVTDGVLKNATESLARTGMQHYTTQSREVLMQGNKKLVPNKFFNSVFDNRRSAICSSYSVDPVFAVDDPKAPSFPLHYNERSNWLYLTEGQTEPDGTRASVGGVKGDAAAERYEKRKNALDKRRDNDKITGKTKSKVVYRGRKDSDTFKAGQISTKAGEDWWRSQPMWWLESNMGVGKAKLFKAGKIGLKDMVDPSNKPISLKQLIASGV